MLPSPGRTFLLLVVAAAWLSCGLCLEPRLVPNQKVQQSENDQRRSEVSRTTNAERFAQNLGPLKPKSLYDPDRVRPAHAPRASLGVPIEGPIGGFNYYIPNSPVICYVKSQECVTAASDAETFIATLGSGPQSNNATSVNGVNLVAADFPTTVGETLTPDNFNYVALNIAQAQTPPDSAPVKYNGNGVESAIFDFPIDVQLDGTIGIMWVNPGDLSSYPTTAELYPGTNYLYATDNPDFYEGYYGGQRVVLKFLPS